jgi:methionine aminotransferase
MAGHYPLREAISSKISRLYGQEYDPETEITITAGATQALFTAIGTIVQEGDEVIVFEPAYDSYTPAIKLNGGTPVYIQLLAPDFNIDWEKVKRAITARTKLIILNSPHNPTGSVLSPEDLVTLAKIVSGTRIYLLSDEAYEHIIFDGLKHCSLAGNAQLRSRSFVVASLGKTYHATGWRMGYIVAPKAEMTEFRKIHQFTVFNSNAPIQFALAEFLNREYEYQNLPDFYQAKRDLFCNLLKDSSFKFTPASGSFFQSMDFSALTDLSDKAFVEWLVKEVGVAAIPYSAFYHQKTELQYVRFCFAKSDETLYRAAEKLHIVMNK